MMFVLVCVSIRNVSAECLRRERGYKNKGQCVCPEKKMKRGSNHLQEVECSLLFHQKEKLFSS